MASLKLPSLQSSFYPRHSHPLPSRPASFSSKTRAYFTACSHAPETTSRESCSSCGTLESTDCTISSCPDAHRTCARRTVFMAVAVTAASFAGMTAFTSEPAHAAPTLSEFASPGQMDVLNRTGRVAHSEEEWRKILTKSEFKVLRDASTELPFSSPLNSEKRPGTFECGGCGDPLFLSSSKYDSGTGWPSFSTAVANSVDELPDYSIFFLPRTEVRCSTCKGHLGHVFNDGPPPTGKRYCMNGDALKFEANDTRAT